MVGTWLLASGQVSSASARMIRGREGPPLSTSMEYIISDCFCFVNWICFGFVNWRLVKEKEIGLDWIGLGFGGTG